ncbi:MAG TPA: glycosyltransferase family 39 protein [Bryobacteraceae bacterium]|nr:glycosyltransferase family 39 protein [Bryobacteraceae bacterium]
MPRKVPRWLWVAPVAAYVLYFQGLSTAGLMGPDEPRYAAIARAMARTGDWVTPRLWGLPWFEKSPLLYWMSAVGFRLGWGPELAVRLPVALLAVAFLALYWWILNREFGCLAASMATWILGTCAAWVGFGYAGVTDLPLAATFSAGMLLALPWIGRGDRRWLPLTAALLGVAMLGKYAVAAVLAAPLGIRWRSLGDLLRPRVVGLFALVALPWYVACFAYNGMAFVKVAWEHQFGRFATSALGHPQPWWYYLPVLAGLLLPWTPLAGLLAGRSGWGDRRRVFLLVWAGFGLLFFSLSVNKLPGYLLPLCPPLAALMGIRLAETQRVRGWLVACALLLVVLPLAVPLIPAALAEGLRRAPHPAFHWSWLLPLAVALPVWFLAPRRRLAATAIVALGATAGAVYVKWADLPQADRLASARPVWRAIEGHPGEVCVDHLKNDFVYGLGYYAGQPLPACSTSPRPVRVVETPGQPPRVEGLAP